VQAVFGGFLVGEGTIELRHISGKLRLLPIPNPSMIHLGASHIF
jgi:hypothetical protein